MYLISLLPSASRSYIYNNYAVKRLMNGGAVSEWQASGQPRVHFRMWLIRYQNPINSLERIREYGSTRVRDFGY